MTNTESETFARDITAENDRRNLDTIDAACRSGRINDTTADYLRLLYSDSMNWFRNVFWVLGKCFGAPKTAVVQYNINSDDTTAPRMKIADINPLSSYLVQHRLDADPMRNQFFTTTNCHQIDLSVSSIVSVIVGAQKNIERAIDKITGKYYSAYADESIETVQKIIAANISEPDAHLIASQLRTKFANQYITSAAEAALELIGAGNERVAAELVRALDKITPPHKRLQDVWRAKCLFDLVPQARTFIERMREIMPDRIISWRDRFYDMENTRNYRDAKLIINIGTHDNVVPMEIIVQVRTFFEFERQTHAAYELSRGHAPKWRDIEDQVAEFMADGVCQYNLMICRCLDDLFERVGWNILYNRADDIAMFEGFPHDCHLYYPAQILDKITDKLDTAVRNEIFHITDSPVKLTRAQEIMIFRYMARFVLISAMPYARSDWTVPSDTLAGKLFNFVMKEVQRYYKK